MVDLKHLCVLTPSLFFEVTVRLQSGKCDRCDDFASVWVSRFYSKPICIVWNDFFMLQVCVIYYDSTSVELAKF